MNFNEVGFCFALQFCNLVYTGMTRAKKLAVFVGTRKALALAVNRQITINFC